MRRPLFFWLCWCFGAAFCLFAVGWPVMPGATLDAFGAADDASARALGLRVASLLLGVGVTLILARHAPPSPTRRAISTGMIALGVAAAAGGVHSIATGAQDGVGVATAIAIEVALAVGFALTLSEASRAVSPTGEASAHS